MASFTPKAKIYSFNSASATKKRAVDAYLLRVFQEKAYRDIKALVQLKIWELEGEDTAKMIDYARDLKNSKASDLTVNLQQSMASKRQALLSSTRLLRAKLVAEDTSAVIDEFVYKWLKDGGNEGEIITQVMAKEMGGQDIKIDWAARILPELETYTAYNKQTIIPAIEAAIGESLPTLMSKNRTPEYARGLLPFTRR